MLKIAKVLKCELCILFVGNFRRVNAEEADCPKAEQSHLSERGALAVSKLREAFSNSQRSLGSPAKTEKRPVQSSSPPQRKLQSFFNVSPKVQTSISKAASGVSDIKEPRGTMASFREVTENQCDLGKGTICAPDRELGFSTPDLSCRTSSDSMTCSPETLVKTEVGSPTAGDLPHVEAEILSQHPDRDWAGNSPAPNCKRLKMETPVKKVEPDSVDVPVTVMKKTVPLNFSMCRLSKQVEKLKRQRRQKEEAEMFRRFRAKISPGENQAAEAELRKEIRYTERHHWLLNVLYPLLAVTFHGLLRLQLDNGWRVTVCRSLMEMYKACVVELGRSYINIYRHRESCERRSGCLETQTSGLCLAK